MGLSVCSRCLGIHFAHTSFCTYLVLRLRVLQSRVACTQPPLGVVNTTLGISLKSSTWTAMSLILLEGEGDPSGSHGPSLESREILCLRLSSSSMMSS